MDNNYPGTNLLHNFNLNDRVYFTDFWGLQSGIVVGITLNQVKVRRPDCNVQYWLDPIHSNIRHMPEGDNHIYSGSKGSKRLI